MNDTPTAADLLDAAPPLAAPPSTPPPNDDFAGDEHSAPPPLPPAPAEVPNPFAGQKDSLKREFHPAKFRLKDGKPQVDAIGRFVPLGLGSRPKSENSDTPPPPGNSRLPDDAPEVLPDFSAELGVDVAIGLVQTALIMIGEEEGVLTEIEQKMLRAPLLRVLTKYNLSSKMTPELEAAAAIATVLMRRLQKPKTQGWFQAKLAWVRSWWINRKLRRAVPMAATA